MVSGQALEEVIEARIIATDTALPRTHPLSGIGDVANERGE
jgi:hypothetical protein